MGLRRVGCLYDDEGGFGCELRVRGWLSNTCVEGLTDWLTGCWRTVLGSNLYIHTDWHEDDMM